MRSRSVTVLVTRQDQPQVRGRRLAAGDDLAAFCRFGPRSRSPCRSRSPASDRFDVAARIGVIHRGTDLRLDQAAHLQHARAQLFSSSAVYCAWKGDPFHGFIAVLLQPIPAGDVVFGALVLAGLVKIFVRVAEFDQLAQVHEGGVVRDARRLLHVVGHDEDGDACP